MIGSLRRWMAGVLIGIVLTLIAPPLPAADFGESVLNPGPAFVTRSDPAPVPPLSPGENSPPLSAARPPDSSANDTARGEPKSTNSAETNGEGKDEKEFKEQRVNYYGQTTVITQWHDSFHSPYEGQHSFQSVEETRTSATATLMLGGRLWQGGELYFDPEIACGLGDSGVFGIAGFPNGDITRVGRPEPTPYVARLYASQSIGFGGEQEQIEAAPNQLASIKDVSRFTFTVGNFAATDFFDNNKYSHDPRSQFMNWALMYNPAWDYPANVRGYTLGAVFELNQKNWALRYGILAEPNMANGADFDTAYSVAHGQAVELEQRYRLNDRPGKIRWLGYWNRANMGNYREALALSPVQPDITATGSYSHIKYGFGMNIEQEISDNLGAFFRMGWNDGQSESWAFTEVDRTVSLGIVLKGAAWCRPQDQLGTGMAINGISSSHAAYLAAGGLGFILGDGQLNYNPEFNWEAYYRFELKKDAIWISPDFQFVADPGYNADRGPVAIYALRVHAEF
jgi:high affinity Mn2+ porin